MGAKKEFAKATQEVAKVANNALDKTGAVGAFFERILGHGFEALGGAFTDWAKTYRYRNALRLADKVEAIHRQRKLDGKTIPIPPRLAIPVIQSATLENDETLQDMWAGLIANATDPARHVSARRIFVDLVSSLEPSDAKILQAIYADEVVNPTRHPRILSEQSEGLPFGPFGMPTDQKRNLDWTALATSLPKADVAFSLENLSRLGLIEDIMPEGGPGAGGIAVPVTNPEATLGVTLIGRALLIACQAHPPE